MNEALIARVGADLRGFKKGMAEVARTARATGSKLAPITRGMSAGFGKITTVIGGMIGRLKQFSAALVNMRNAVVVAVGAFATKAFIRFGANFDRSMNIVRVVSGATAKEFAALKAKAMEMGETTEFTAAQSAEALKFLSMAGLTAAQSLKALPQMLDLATAGQIDLARAADISTNIMTMMGLKVGELTRVNDALVAVQSTANTNIEEAAQAFIYAGVKAKTFGVDVEELSAMIGMLANSGIKATLAGTTIRQAMMRLLVPTSDAKRILEKYGVAITDTTGKLRDFEEILYDLADAELSAIEITQLFGARAGNIQVILDQGSEALRNYIGRLRSMKGTAESAAGTIRKDVQGALNELRSIIEAQVLTLWDRYRDKIKGTIRSITSWIRGHSEEIQIVLSIVAESARFLSNAFTSLWHIISSFPLGVLGYFSDVKEKMDGVSKAAESIRPPPKSNWNDFVIFMTRWGEDIISVFKFMGESVGEIFAAMIADAIATVTVIGKEFWNLGKLIWHSLSFNFDAVRKDWDNLVRDTTEFNKKIEANWNATTESLASSWNEMLTNMMARQEAPIPAIVSPGELPATTPPEAPSRAPSEIKVRSAMKMADEVAQWKRIALTDMFDLHTQAEAVWENTAHGMIETNERVLESYKNIVRGIEEVIGSRMIDTFDRMMDTLEEGKFSLESFGQAFTQMISGLLRDIARLVYAETVAKPIAGVISGAITGFASSLFGGVAKTTISTGGPVSMPKLPTWGSTWTAGEPSAGFPRSLQHGGILDEPITGFGLSGRRYTFAETGPEKIEPLSSTAGTREQAPVINLTFQVTAFDDVAVSRWWQRNTANITSILHGELQRGDKRLTSAISGAVRG